MELPSMVQRSGDTLIVRSVVSGNQLYIDKGVHISSVAAASNQLPQLLQNTSVLELQMERYRAAAMAQQQQQFLQNANAQQQQQMQQQATSSAAHDLKDEGLPQCKIKRNYSCSYCTYFTQNPRCHLTHLRDVHGEKIVINNCKLCLYASRHFQKLVRHMKMVHGCTDGITGAHGQARGKRGMSREARKRKLEQSVGIGSSDAIVPAVTEMPTLEQVKRELELQEQKLQRDIQAFNKQQEEQKQQQQLANSAAYFVTAYERELKAQRERNAYDQDVELLHQHSPTTNNNNNNANSASTSFQIPTAHQQQPQQQQPPAPLQLTNRNLDFTPSSSGSASPTVRTSTPNNTSAALCSGASTSHAYTEEPAQNRLLKCSICDYTTLYRAQLLEHEMEEHCKTKFFRCEKCSYVTHIKARFSKHVKYHSMPMIKCVTCDFRTPYKWNLDRHMKNHGGAGPFKCAACDFTADIKQSLTVHEMNHHVPPVGHAAGMPLSRRRNKVGGTDLCDDSLSDSADMMDDQYNNNFDEYDEATAALIGESYNIKKGKYDVDVPTDLSQKGGSSDTSSVHNQAENALTPRSKRPVPNLIPIPKTGSSVLNLSKDLAASRSSLSEIAKIFFNEKQISEMLQPLDKSDAAQLSPTMTITSTSSHNSRSLLPKKTAPPGSFFDKLKSTALASVNGVNANLICSCGHVAKCLSESIIHRKTCSFASNMDDDVEEEEEDEDEHDDEDTEGRLEIDMDVTEEKQSHSALNLSLTGSTRCQYCRHRCKSSADLLNHLKHCSDAGRCGNESYDSLSGESIAGRGGGSADSVSEQQQQHPMENRVFIWNKMPRGAGVSGSQCSDGQALASDSSVGGILNHNSNEENSYYGVETAPGYGEVTKKMTPEEEAANSSLKKVYKCPHCSFWASTASRFHVHIVGHLNKKPFECSLCSYRSNWRWDITKHIRLKTIRDPSHKSARVLMNDETGRRNYTKYNKYITLMKVTEEDGDPKLMKSGEMTPNQVASLAFLNDFNKSSATNEQINLLNGLKDDITLEPIPSKSATNPVRVDVGDNPLSDDYLRLPLLATMMNAMAQQQQQQHQQKDTEATMITPSVTISPVKRTTPAQLRPSDDLITDVKQEGNEKKTYYKCRKCSFRHNNRDAVLAHVKIHYQDVNYPSITTTAINSTTKSTNLQQEQVAVNSNLYMNKMLAAMCLSQQQQTQQQQQQQQQQTSANSQQHSILSASNLLQQAIQGAHTPNSSLSGLALALAGKSPTKSATSILEHGEQKAIPNEASAQATSSPPTKIASSTQHDSPSLQHLLTTPRGTYAGFGIGTNNNNNHLVKATTTSSSSSSSSTAAATTGTAITAQNHPPALSTIDTYTINSTTTTGNANTTRHCRLKHAGDICIEALDRFTTIERNLATYRPIGNGASNETNYGQTFKALQQQQQQQQQEQQINLNNNNNNGRNKNNNNNNSSVLINNKNEQLLLSPLAVRAAAVAANAATTSQDLQVAAAAYLAAAYKAATASVNASSATTTPTTTATTTATTTTTHINDDLLLQQQLQQNAEIEITRLPPSNAGAATSHLTQMLEKTNVGMQQQNSKCKQQKCPHCPCISESKSQMNYHISLHKPTQYECGVCSFVCAKKQHLSAHMRCVHSGAVSTITTATAATNSVNLRSVLHMTNARPQQEPNAASVMMTPLAIDLTALKPTLNAVQTEQSPLPQTAASPITPDQLPPEYQYKMISYCPKCPARFAQKHNEMQNAHFELVEHLKSHVKKDKQPFTCEFCNFGANHETHVRTHRYVHTQSYQDKFNALYKNCKEDTENASPKLLQITLAKNLQTPEIVWVVDNELNDKVQQNSSISSSTNAQFDNANSLLKKQLESGPAPLVRNTPSPEAVPVDEDSSNIPSTSASVATSDLAADVCSESMSTATSPAPLEKCVHCPYETNNINLYKDHLQHHICITGQKDEYTCEHCDYSDNDNAQIEEHTRVHFNTMEKLKSVAFFTSYNKLELSVENDEMNNNDETEVEKQIGGLRVKREREQEQNNNNNNEENAVNENTLQELLKMKTAACEEQKDDEKIEMQQQKGIEVKPTDANTNESAAKRHCNKIILYKNDGGVMRVKSCSPNNNINNSSGGSSSENISTRLRRRERSHSNSGTGAGLQTPQQSQKTVLVNAKTGQVISRNY